MFKIRGSLFRVKGYRQIDKELVKSKLLSSFEATNLLFDFVRSMEFWSGKNEYSLVLPESLGDSTDICNNKVVITWFSENNESDKNTLYIPILDI